MFPIDFWSSDHKLIITIKRSDCCYLFWKQRHQIREGEKSGANISGNKCFLGTHRRVERLSLGQFFSTVQNTPQQHRIYDRQVFECYSSLLKENSAEKSGLEKFTEK